MTGRTGKTEYRPFEAKAVRQTEIKICLTAFFFFPDICGKMKKCSGICFSEAGDINMEGRVSIWD